MNSWRVIVGDALERLRELEDGCVQTCVTSPPYFGLRDYGTGAWSGGDEGCDHKKDGATKTFGNPEFNANRPSREATDTVGFRDVCGKCGATRTDSQLGLEKTPDEYVARLVEVFREVRRVLRDDGTLWLNLGDSYASSPPGQVADPFATSSFTGGSANHSAGRDGKRDTSRLPGTKPKDLLGIPWLVAFALRADGWYLRSDIVWAKPNPMPESVTDRPTKAHEYVFLLSKSPRYFYDADAVREPHGTEWIGRAPTLDLKANGDRGDAGTTGNEAGRNKRSVWTVATAPFPGAHFAVFPPKLIEPCVKAGSAEDACGVCGAPWVRVVERTPMVVRPTEKRADWQAEDDHARTQVGGTMLEPPESRTVGFEPSCSHQDKTGSSVVLDPFSGAGTTGLVATRLGRSYIGIELNPAYAEMSRERIRDDAPLMNYIFEAV